MSTTIPYGRADRLLHRIAFGTREIQKALADVEDRRFRARIDLGQADRPVFVTSLPRAGTTILLKVLAELPELASATYRHMPFPMLPLLWSEGMRGLQRGGGAAERAHGDGIAHDFDSAEAFEEPLWMAFFPRHFRGPTIPMWREDAEVPDFADAFRRHRAKVVASAGGPARRYVSKNNANIARLGLLRRLCPDASIVVPVRDPWAQVTSLHRQHTRFAALHAAEPFGRRYMEGVGHFEFGAALRPIAFRPNLDPAAADGVDFWLRYWIAAYEVVLETAGPETVFVDHDTLSADPEPHLAALGEAIGIEAPEALVAQAPVFVASREVKPPDVAPALVSRAAELHSALRARCLRPAPRPLATAGFAS